MSFLVGNIQIIDLKIDLRNPLVQVNQLCRQSLASLLSRSLEIFPVRIIELTFSRYTNTEIHQHAAINTRNWSYLVPGDCVYSHITIIHLNSDGRYVMLISTKKKVSTKTKNITHIRTLGDTSLGFAWLGRTETEHNINQTLLQK